MGAKRNQKTTVGTIHPDALAYTAGRDVELDRVLVEADCIGTAAHVTMLSRMPAPHRLFTKADLQPFYAHAQRELDLDETGGEDELWERHGLRRPPWSSEVIGSAFWQFDNAADRFASKNPQQIKESPLARILLQ